MNVHIDPMAGAVHGPFFEVAIPSQGLFNRLRDDAQANEALGKNDVSASCGAVEVADLCFNGSDLRIENNLVNFTLGIGKLTGTAMTG